MTRSGNLWQVSFNVTTELTEEMLAAERKRHQAYLMVDRGTILGVPDAITNLPKQQLSRFRKFFKSIFRRYFLKLYRRLIIKVPYGTDCSLHELDIKKLNLNE